ncbi:cinnamyl alcohol dehydrogenase [Streptomyces amakusaensis]|uniref:Cinnamyl alcohol dehydrogenase n=1 Tax=Streptomyces amakusaensis TaxID=67271 RepID=A0ABW0ARX2_9ACTN
MTLSRRTLLTGLGLTAGGVGLGLTHSTASATTATALTAGWTQTPFTFHVQKPYDLAVADRYTHTANGEHHLWVYDTDKLHTPNTSSTDPRTEMRWQQEYTAGEHMWDGDVYLPAGTDGATFVQILRSQRPEGTPATDFMLNVYNEAGGTVRAYSGKVIKTGMYDRWFNVKIAHNATTGTVQVWFDNAPVAVHNDTDRGPATRHFKNGVYHHGTGRAESRFRNLTYWTR